jgi:hypothetical protein
MIRKKTTWEEEEKRARRMRNEHESVLVKSERKDYSEDLGVGRRVAKTERWIKSKKSVTVSSQTFRSLDI